MSATVEVCERTFLQTFTVTLLNDLALSNDISSLISPDLLTTLPALLTRFPAKEELSTSGSGSASGASHLSALPRTLPLADKMSPSASTFLPLNSTVLVTSATDHVLQSTLNDATNNTTGIISDVSELVYLLVKKDRIIWSLWLWLWLFFGTLCLSNDISILVNDVTILINSLAYHLLDITLNDLANDLTLRFGTANNLTGIVVDLSLLVALLAGKFLGITFNKLTNWVSISIDNLSGLVDLETLENGDRWDVRFGFLLDVLSSIFGLISSAFGVRLGLISCLLEALLSFFDGAFSTFLGALDALLGLISGTFDIGLSLVSCSLKTFLSFFDGAFNTFLGTLDALLGFFTFWDLRSEISLGIKIGLGTKISFGAFDLGAKLASELASAFCDTNVHDSLSNAFWNGELINWKQINLSNNGAILSNKVALIIDIDTLLADQRFEIDIMLEFSNCLFVGIENLARLLDLEWTLEFGLWDDWLFDWIGIWFRDSIFSFGFGVVNLFFGTVGGILKICLLSFKTRFCAVSG
ncbi:hypothetical protein BOTNAR_0045g00430 [Botryotinia narcissicola]|uniref:Uncharacterized protein n=1 Tax=Botryotinia narcissicola TaxID=278944 RepID=A0A4Z1JEC4_9HELO|nr:hypothetical protein BOTNAR_0045g00430 [Botryotinia narcissicola]